MQTVKNQPCHKIKFAQPSSIKEGLYPRSVGLPSLLEIKIIVILLRSCPSQSKSSSSSSLDFAQIPLELRFALNFFLNRVT